MGPLLELTEPSLLEAADDPGSPVPPPCHTQHSCSHQQAGLMGEKLLVDNWKKKTPERATVMDRVRDQVPTRFSCAKVGQRRLEGGSELSKGTRECSQVGRAPPNPAWCHLLPLPSDGAGRGQ